MKLTIFEMPIPPSESSRDYRVLRHWLTMPDGRLYYQDETLRYAYPDPETKDWTSDRSPWFQLLTPESADVVVSTVWDEAEGAPLVFMASGKAYHFTYRNGDKLPHFYPTVEPVPDTEEDAKARPIPKEIHGS